MARWRQYQPSGGTRTQAPTPQEREEAAQRAVVERFAWVDKEAVALRKQRAAGRITAEELTARLRQLMVQARDGSWWIAGLRAGEWYRHDGVNWVHAQPPNYASHHRAAHSPPLRQNLLRTPRRRRGMALLLAVAGISVSWLLGAGAARLAQALLSLPTLSTVIVAMVIGVIGTVIVALQSRSLWHGL